MKSFRIVLAAIFCSLVVSASNADDTDSKPESQQKVVKKDRTEKKKAVAGEKKRNQIQKQDKKTKAKVSEAEKMKKRKLQRGL